MKNFKRVLSLALAALMVIGGLVVAPIDAKAEETYNRVWDKRDVEEGGEFVIVFAKADGSTTTYYAMGNTFASNNRPKQVEVVISNNVVSLPEGATGTIPTWTFTNTETTTTSAEVSRIKLSYINGEDKTYISANGTKWTVGTDASAAEEWIVSENNDYFSILGSVSNRYVCCYTNGSDFRPYTVGTSDAAGRYEFMLFKAGTVISEQDDIDEVLTPELDTYEKIVDAAYALETGAGLKDSGDGSTSFTLKGTVISYDGIISYNSNPIYTIVVEGKESKPIELFGLSAGSATNVDAKSVQVGDIVTVTGPIRNNNDTIQFNGCTLDAYTEGPGVGTYADQQAVVDAVLALDHGYGLAGTHTLSGVVSKVENSTVTFKIGEATITVYKPVDADKVAIDLTTVEVGDTIAVTGHVKNYNDTVSFLSGSTAVVTKAEVEDPSESENPSGSEEDDSTSESDSETDELTQAEIMDLANGLASGESLEGTYTLVGKVLEVSEVSKYGDVNVTLEVDGTDGKTIYCYGVKGDGNTEIAVGDKIAVTGTIKNYEGTVEFYLPNFIPATGDFSSVGTVMILIAGVACLAVAFVSKKKMA